MFFKEGYLKLKNFIAARATSSAWRWSFFCVAFLVLLWLGILIGLWLARPTIPAEVSPPEDIPPASVTTTVPMVARPLDGVLLPASDYTGQSWPLAVMMDNLIDARPQYGISQALLVIEAPVEGPITRFLAFFDSAQKVSSIGPVRSARPYFAEWAAELGALYVHSGGSPEALRNLSARAYDLTGLNEFSNGQYFWRSKQRYAPHNLITSNEELSQALADKNLTSTPPDFTIWRFQDAPTSTTATSAVAVKIPYNQAENMVAWQYIPETNTYQRHQGGKPHLDSDHNPILASNIVVQWTKMTVIDSVGRRRLTTTGTGLAWIFQNGQKTIGTWNKSKNGRTRFLDASGQEIIFNRGATWIEVVGDNTPVE